MLLLRPIFIWPAITTLWQTSNRGGTPVIVIFILLLLVIALYWWGLNRPSYDQIATADDHHAPDPHHDVDTHA